MVRGPSLQSEPGRLLRYVVPERIKFGWLEGQGKVDSQRRPIDYAERTPCRTELARMRIYVAITEGIWRPELENWK
jgi:hypothetical protein